MCFIETFRKLNFTEEYRASAKGALAKGPFLLRGPIHRTRFSTGPIHCTCIFNLKKKIFFYLNFCCKNFLKYMNKELVLIESLVRWIGPRRRNGPLASAPLALARYLLPNCRFFSAVLTFRNAFIMCALWPASVIPIVSSTSLETLNIHCKSVKVEAL